MRGRIEHGYSVSRGSVPERDATRYLSHLSARLLLSNQHHHSHLLPCRSLLRGRSSGSVHVQMSGRKVQQLDRALPSVAVSGLLTRVSGSWSKFSNEHKSLIAALLVFSMYCETPGLEYPTGECWGGWYCTGRSEFANPSDANSESLYSLVSL